MGKLSKEDWQPEPLKFSEILEVTDQAVTVRAELTGRPATIKHKLINDRQGDTVFIPRWLCRSIFADHQKKENK